MFVPVLFLAVLVGLLRGGRLEGLAATCFRHAWLVLSAFAIRFALYAGLSHGIDPGSTGAALLQVVAYGLLAVGVGLNRHLAGFPTIAAGLLANAVAITANGGRMPVSREALIASGQAHLIDILAGGGSHTHQLLDAGSRLPWLADVFALPAWWPLATAFSLGDAAIAAGMFAFVQRRMGSRPQPGSVVE